MAATIQPTAQNDSSSTVMRPRCLVGENSETSVEATGSSAPKPSPMISRAPSSMPSDQDRAMAPLAMPKIISVAVNTVLRPTRSPPTAAPMAMPTKPMDSTQLFSVGVRLKCGSAAMAATTKDTKPTSMASNAQPMPEATRSLRCALLKGSRSRRSLRVSCAGCAEVVVLTSFSFLVSGVRFNGGSGRCRTLRWPS